MICFKPLDEREIAIAVGRFATITKHEMLLSDTKEKN